MRMHKNLTSVFSLNPVMLTAKLLNDTTVVIGFPAFEKRIKTHIISKDWFFSKALSRKIEL